MPADWMIHDDVVRGALVVKRARELLTPLAALSGESVGDIIAHVDKLGGIEMTGMLLRVAKTESDHEGQLTREAFASLISEGTQAVETLQNTCTHNLKVAPQPFCCSLILRAPVWTDLNWTVLHSLFLTVRSRSVLPSSVVPLRPMPTLCASGCVADLCVTRGDQ